MTFPWEHKQYPVGNADEATNKRFATMLEKSFVETRAELQKNVGGLWPGQRDALDLPDFLKR